MWWWTDENTRDGGEPWENLETAAEKYIAQEQGQEIWLHAQTLAEQFYSKFGYMVCGDIEYDEHCPHFWMKKVL